MSYEVAIVIGSDKGRLEKFIENINKKISEDRNQDFYSPAMKDFFQAFKLIRIENDFWVFAFFDRECEWNDEHINMFYTMKDEIEKEKLSYTLTRFYDETDYEEESNALTNNSFDIRLLNIAKVNIVATLDFSLEPEFIHKL